MGCGCKKNKVQTTEQPAPNYVVTNETTVTEKVLQAIAEVKNTK